MLSSLRNFAITFLVSLVIFGALAYCFAMFAVNSLAGGFTDGSDTQTSDTEAPEVYDPFADQQEVDISTIAGDSFNFLLVGLDYQPDVFDDYYEDIRTYLDAAYTGVPVENATALLSYEQKRSISADAILVGRVDKESRELILTALPGSTRVFVDGVYTMLGDTLIEKGIDFFAGKVTALTGFSIDYYAVLSIPEMEKIIDRLGGLSFQVPCDMEYSDPDEGEEGLTISLKAGTQWLSGKTAVQVLRYATYADKDISRMRVLRDMAASLMTSASRFSTVQNAVDLYKSMKNLLVTNFSIADFTDHVDLIFKLEEFSVVNYTYPGEMVNDNGIEYFSPNTSTALSALLQYKD